MRLWRRRTERTSAATRARIKAEHDLEEIRAETPKIRALAQSLVEIQKTNHLGQAAARVLRGEK